MSRMLISSEQVLALILVYRRAVELVVSAGPCEESNGGEDHCDQLCEYCAMAQAIDSKTLLGLEDQLDKAGR